MILAIRGSPFSFVYFAGIAKIGGYSPSTDLLAPFCVGAEHLKSKKTGLIDLVTVSDAILTGRQTRGRHKIQRLYAVGIRCQIIFIRLRS